MLATDSNGWASRTVRVAEFVTFNTSITYICSIIWVLIHTRTIQAWGDGIDDAFAIHRVCNIDENGRESIWTFPRRWRVRFFVIFYSPVEWLGSVCNP